MNANISGDRDSRPYEHYDDLVYVGAIVPVARYSFTVVFGIPCLIGSQEFVQLALAFFDNAPDACRFSFGDV